METIYRTIDGKEFTNKDLAVAHESKLGKFDMIGYQGCDTCDTECAAVVVLYDALSADEFLKSAKEQGDFAVKGIDSGDTGIFLWERFGEQYRLIEDTVCIAIKSAFAKMDEHSITEAFANQIAEAEETDDLLPF